MTKDHVFSVVKKHLLATIEGLDESNHAEYCRDALKSILDACPAIAGVTLRVHGESGVPEGNYDFWQVEHFESP